MRKVRGRGAGGLEIRAACVGLIFSSRARAGGFSAKPAFDAVGFHEP
jgi:hypothetical protein